MRNRAARFFASRGGLRRAAGAYWNELSNHLVEGWFMVTAKPRARFSKCVRAVRYFTRRR